VKYKSQEPSKSEMISRRAQPPLLKKNEGIRCREGLAKLEKETSWAGGSKSGGPWGRAHGMETVVYQGSKRGKIQGEHKGKNASPVNAGETGCTQQIKRPTQKASTCL